MRTKMKMAFSGLSLMRLRMTYTNCPTVRSEGTRYLYAWVRDERRGRTVVCKELLMFQRLLKLEGFLQMMGPKVDWGRPLASPAHLWAPPTRSEGYTARTKAPEVTSTALTSSYQCLGCHSSPPSPQSPACTKENRLGLCQQCAGFRPQDMVVTCMLYAVVSGMQMFGRGWVWVRSCRAWGVHAGGCSAALAMVPCSRWGAPAAPARDPGPGRSCSELACFPMAWRLSTQGAAVERCRLKTLVARS